MTIIYDKFCSGGGNNDPPPPLSTKAFLSPTYMKRKEVATQRPLYFSGAHVIHASDD